MFGTILTVAFTALLAYVFWRVASIPLVARHASRKTVAGTALALWLTFFLGRTLEHGGSGFFALGLNQAGMILLGCVFIASTMMFIADCVTLFGYLAWAPMVRGWALGAGIALSAFSLVQGFRAPAVVSYDVTLPGLPVLLDGKVIVALSDTHVGSLLGEKWFSERMKQVSAIHPDMVVFLGDMFEGHGASPREIPSLRWLTPHLGKWYVVGNHESFRGAEPVNDVLEKGGFRRLANQWVSIAPGLVLAGVDDLTNRKHRNLGGDPLGEALSGRPPGATLLLSHSPLQTDRAASSGVGLMLSGHTHGGQIWPFGYLVQRVYPYLTGRYDVNGMTLIVSRGTGTWGPRMRLWNRGEILKVTLRADRPAYALNGSPGGQKAKTFFTHH
jgi:uncharacterized protein